MNRWLPLTVARLAVLLCTAAALGLAVFWLRPAGYPHAAPVAWREWAREADWAALARDPWDAFVRHQPRWSPPAPIAPALPEVPQPLPEVSVGSAALRERPLFVPDRRPAPPPPPPQAAKPPDPLDDAALVGLMTGERAVAIVRTAQGTRRISVGAALGDWTLQSLDAQRAEFVRGQENRTLRLEVAVLGAPNPSARPAAAVPPGDTAVPANTLPPNLQAVLERTQREMEERARARAAAGLPPLK